MDRKIENIKFKVIENKPCEQLVDVLVPVDVVKAESESFFKKLQPNAKLPGFRPGKASMTMVKQAYSGKAKQDVVDSLISRAIYQFIEEKNIRMISHPRLEDMQFDFEKDFSFKVHIESAPDFSLKSYTKMKIEKTEKESTGADVDKEINILQERNAVLEPTQDESAAEKHMCVVDFIGKIDGKIEKDLVGNGQLINLSAKQQIPGFNEGVIGMKKNETKDVEVIFPGDFPNKAHADKKAVLTITLKELKNLKVPEADDALAKDMGFENLEKLRSTILGHMKANNENEARKKMKNQISGELTKINKFAVPESLVKHQLTDMINSAKEMIKRNGNFSEKDWEESLPALGEKYKASAEEKVRLYFIISRIVEQEKITVADDELEKQKQAMKAYMRMADSEFGKYFENKKEDVTAHIKEEKVFDFIIGNAKIKIKK